MSSLKIFIMLLVQFGSDSSFFWLLRMPPPSYNTVVIVQHFHFSPTDNTITLNAKLKKKNQRGKLPAVSEESSTGDSPIIQKRKRRQPGEWWVSSCERPEDTDVPDSQPTPKKAKQNKKEPKISLNSPETGKDRVEKKRTQKQPAQSSLPKPKTQPLKNGNKEKRDKQKNNLNLKGCAPGRRKLFDEVEAGQVEQQEVVDQDLGPVHSSPLILPERDHSHNPSKKSLNSMIPAINCCMLSRS